MTNHPMKMKLEDPNLPPRVKKRITMGQLKEKVIARNNANFLVFVFSPPQSFLFHYTDVCSSGLQKV
jgi:hypothetical protein